MGRTKGKTFGDFRVSKPTKVDEPSSSRPEEHYELECYVENMHPTAARELLAKIKSECKDAESLYESLLEEGFLQSLHWTELVACFCPDGVFTPLLYKALMYDGRIHGPATMDRESCLDLFPYLDAKSAHSLFHLLVISGHMNKDVPPSWYTIVFSCNPFLMSLALLWAHKHLFLDRDYMENALCQTTMGRFQFAHCYDTRFHDVGSFDLDNFNNWTDRYHGLRESEEGLLYWNLGFHGWLRRRDPSLIAAIDIFEEKCKMPEFISHLKVTRTLPGMNHDYSSVDSVYWTARKCRLMADGMKPGVNRRSLLTSLADKLAFMAANISSCDVLERT